MYVRSHTYAYIIQAMGDNDRECPHGDPMKMSSWLIGLRQDIKTPQLRMDNYRDERNDTVDELAVNIETQGYRDDQIISIRCIGEAHDGRRLYVVIDGHHRVLAIIKLQVYSHF